MKKLNRKSVSLPLLREPAPAPYFHPLFFNFQIRPLGEVVKIPSPFKKGEVGLNYAGVQCHDEQIRHVTHLQTFTIKFWVKTTINIMFIKYKIKKIIHICIYFVFILVFTAAAASRWLFISHHLCFGFLDLSVGHFLKFEKCISLKQIELSQPNFSSNNV